MSKRSVRKRRHYTKPPTFKESMLAGQVKGQVIRGELKVEEIPQWMWDSGILGFGEADLKAPEEPEPEPIIVTTDAIRTEPKSEHVHGPGCHHEH